MLRLRNLAIPSLLLVMALLLAACPGQATPEPTATPEPAEAPAEEAAPEPTEAPVEEPTEAPAEEPTEAPAEEPTEAPVEEPTEVPAEEPTEVPAEEPTEVPAEEPTEAPAEEAPAEANTVQVSLVEYAIEMPDSLPAGPTVFEVTNDGSFAHNFAIEGQGIEQVFDTDLEPGETRTLEVDLQAGTYEVYCPIGTHAEQGMELELTVTEGM
jgi:plastocyanin